MTNGEGRAARGRSRFHERLTALMVLLLWLGFVFGAVLWVHALGGPLAPPPVTDLGGVGDWLHARQPDQAAFAVVRLVALGLAWYLLVATVAGVLARISRVPALVRAADLFTIPAVRRLLHASASVTIVAASFTAATDSAAADDRSAPPEPAQSGEVTTVPRDHDEAPASFPGPPTLRRLPDEPRPVPPALQPPSELTTSGPLGAEPRRWEVRHGQHFWAIAEDVLAAAWSRPPTDAEIDPYWRVLVEANRSILRDPANPDLLYPAQVITIPEPRPEQ